MSKIKILIADDIDLSGADILPKGKYMLKSKFGISNSEILESFSDHDILIIRSIRKINREFLEKCNFKVIATCSKGTDHIDTSYAKLKGIKILNADDSNNISAAEHAMALILAIEKKIIFSDKLVRKNNFSFYDYERRELSGKSIGIIGFGKVGNYLGKLCTAFGMKVFANDTDVKVILKNKKYNFKSLDFILKNCDIISIHIPLDEKNFHFISKDKLKLLNKNSILINTSRGDVMEENILLKMLKDKKIKYAGLDVFSNEPHIDRAFTGLENAVLTNHIAGKTVESRKNVSRNIFLQIKLLR